MAHRVVVDPARLLWRNRHQAGPRGEPLAQFQHDAPDQLLEVDELLPVHPLLVRYALANEAPEEGVEVLIGQRQVAMARGGVGARPLVVPSGRLHHQQVRIHMEGQPEEIPNRVARIEDESDVAREENTAGDGLREPCDARPQVVRRESALLHICQTALTVSLCSHAVIFMRKAPSPP